MSCTYTYKNKQYSYQGVLNQMVKEMPVNNQSGSITWLSEKLGMSKDDVVIVSGLISGSSLGRFMEDGRILLSSHSEMTTAYHEAFHRVWRMYLSPMTRTMLVNEFKKRPKYKKLLEPLKNLYPELTETELIEEYFADEFADYTEGIYKPDTITKSFFDKIIDFIMNVLGMETSDIYDIYDRINKGEFKTAQRVSYMTGNADSRVSRTNVVQMNDAKRSLFHMTIRNILNENRIDDIISGNAEINMLKAYGAALQNLLRSVDRNKFPEVYTELYSQLDDFVKTKGKTPGSMYGEVVKKLSSLAITISETQEEDIDVEKANTSDADMTVDDKTSRDFIASFEIDPKASLSNRIKLVLASLSDGKTNALGMTSQLSWSQAFVQIAEYMSGTPSRDFMEHLAKFNMPFTRELIDILRDNPSFRNEFISAFTLTKNDFKILMMAPSDIYLIDADQNTREKKIIRDMQNALIKKISEYRTLDDFKSAITGLKTGQQIIDFYDLKLNPAILNDRTVNFLFAVFKDTLTEKLTDKTNMQRIFDSVEVKGTIKKIAASQSQHVLQTDAMVYAMSKKLYAYSLPNQQSTIFDTLNYILEHKFTSDMSIEQRYDMIYDYLPELNNKFIVSPNGVKYSALLEQIVNGNRIDLSIVYNAKNERGEEVKLEDMDETDLAILGLKAAETGHVYLIKHSDRSTYFVIKPDNSMLLSQIQEKGAIDYLTDYLTKEIIRETIQEKFDNVYQNIDKLNTPGIALILGKERAEQLKTDRKITPQDKQKIKQFAETSINGYLSFLRSYGVESKLSGLPVSNIPSLYVYQMIVNMEYMKLMSGDFRVYGSAPNMFKRLSTISSTGIPLSEDESVENQIEREIDGVYEIINPLTGKPEQVQYKTERGMFRSVTTEENDAYVSYLTVPNESLISKIDGSQLSLIEYAFEMNFIEDGTPVDKAIKKRKDYSAKYKKVNIDDGQSHMTIIGFKQYMMRLGKWNDAMERVYRIEMDIMRGVDPKDIYFIEHTKDGPKQIFPFELQKNDDFRHRQITKTVKRTNEAGQEISETKTIDQIDFSPMHSIKPQFAGYSISAKDYDMFVKTRNEWVSTVLKDSKHILLPSAIKGTNLELLNYALVKNNIENQSANSANKVGGLVNKSKPFSFYDKNGNFNLEFLDNNKDELVYLLPARYFKEQLKIGNKVKKEIKGSTQSLKIMLSNLMINGKERFPGAKELSDRYMAIVNNSIAVKREQLIKELDIVDGSIKSKDKLLKVLMSSNQMQTAPENMINAVLHFIEDENFMVLPNRQQIENIVYAMFGGRIIDFNRTGNAYPQASSIGYEPIGEGSMTTGNYLQFYKPVIENGKVVKIKPAEIILPLPDIATEAVLAKYKTRNLSEAINKLNADIDNGLDILVKGLRIPNQQLSSNDIMRVRKFLLPTGQAFVVTPPEIVVKTGSDYDIDKINIYWGDLAEKINPTGKPKSVEQQLLDIETEILLHPRNYHHLLMPVTEEIFVEKIYNKVMQLTGEDNDTLSFVQAMQPHTNIEKSIIFVKGKQAVGAVALQITGHSAAQIDGFKLRPQKFPIGGYENLTYAMDSYLDIDGNYITEALSQLLTIQVDNVKNPRGVLMNITMRTVGMLGYAIRLGVNPEHVVMLFKQPIVQQFLKEQAINESMANKTYGFDMNLFRLLEEFRKKYNLTETYKFSKTKKSNIEPPPFLTPEQMEQDLLTKNRENDSAYLDMFLLLNEEARKFSQWVRYYVPDTKKFSSLSSIETAKELERTIDSDAVSELPFFDNEAINHAVYNGVLSTFFESRKLTRDTLEKFYPALYTTAMAPHKAILRKDVAGTLNKEKAVEKLMSDTIAFHVQNKVIANSDQYKSLMSGPDSVAKRFFAFREQYPDLVVSRALMPEFAKNRIPSLKINADIIRIYERELNEFEINDVLDGMRELETLDKQLYDDMILLLFLQSGTANSPFNYMKIIPVGKPGESGSLMSYILDATRNFAHHEIPVFFDMFLTNNAHFLGEKRKQSVIWKFYEEETKQMFVRQPNEGRMGFVNGNKVTLFYVTNESETKPKVKQTTININSYEKNGYQTLSTYLNGPFNLVKNDKTYTYKTVEHYYQVQRAVNSGDIKLANQIYKAETAKDAVKLAQQIKETPEWNTLAFSVLETGLNMAFEQNPEQMKLLLSTGSAVLTHNKKDTALSELLTKIRDNARTVVPGEGYIGVLNGKTRTYHNEEHYLMVKDAYDKGDLELAKQLFRTPFEKPVTEAEVDKLMNGLNEPGLTKKKVLDLVALTGIDEATQQKEHCQQDQ